MVLPSLVPGIHLGAYALASAAVALTAVWASLIGSLIYLGRLGSN